MFYNVTQIKLVNIMKKQINDLLLKMQTGENCIGETANHLLNLFGVVNCVYVVTERDNYGEQLFKGVFANREKAVKFLAEDGLKESNIDEINEIELD